MGIKSLLKFLKEVCPQIFEPIHISEYQYRKVAIDTSLYLCSYKALYGDEGWLGAFIKLISCLRENHVHCVFIYDSGCPPEKEHERKNRRDNRQKLDDRIQAIDEAVTTYHETKEVSKVLLEFQEKRGIQMRSLLTSSGNSQGVNIHGIEESLGKMKKQAFTVTQEDFDKTKELFRILDVPFHDAPLEAETACSDLAKRGEVDAVLSEDSDVIAYGAPVFITKIDSRSGKAVRVRIEAVLEALEFTYEQLLDFCIMCGTDYNSNIFRIGPKKAFDLMKKHKSIEKIGSSTALDISVLNHERVRSLFLGYEECPYSPEFCGKPDFEKLEEFVRINKVKFNLRGLEKSFSECRIVFEE